MLLNLSNHPSSKWPPEQIAVAKQTYGNIEDIPFPNIDPHANSQSVSQLAEVFFEKIKAHPAYPSITVHLMGEMTFCYQLVTRLKKAGLQVVASTTDRIVVEESDGRKTVQFRFVQFREY